MLEIWYEAMASSPLESLFKWWSPDPNWPRPRRSCVWTIGSWIWKWNMLNKKRNVSIGHWCLPPSALSKIAPWSDVQTDGKPDPYIAPCMRQVRQQNYELDMNKFPWSLCTNCKGGLWTWSLEHTNEQTHKHTHTHTQRINSISSSAILWRGHKNLLQSC